MTRLSLVEVEDVDPERLRDGTRDGRGDLERVLRDSVGHPVVLHLKHGPYWADVRAGGIGEHVGFVEAVDGQVALRSTSGHLQQVPLDDVYWCERLGGAW